ncbi:hypothetical protein E1A91_A05G318600v1 [Gossypium mustelinum]|uniref:Uncharacterized protein n=2 Tax=Gossypium TaxID=3633 RepID=A0A5J5VX51_GOSBA|nr:hypothetical protein ES319_A05G310200v1 [Gossypium barbadense]TYJ36610.1 hypothetical protein E1A91_A05G318600v1 [Gossypium mustelinum]
MAGPLVGEPYLSAALQVLFDRLASQQFLNFIRGKKLEKGLVKKLNDASLRAPKISYSL